MTVTISLSPETEAKLNEKAAATGKDVATLVLEAVEEKLGGGSAPLAPEETSYEKWKAEFNAWVASHRPVRHFVDDSPESIHAGRGE